MELTTTGVRSTAMGYFACHDNNGSDNVGIGAYALRFNVDGHDNTAVGAFALNSNNAFSNTAMGKWSLQDNVLGTQNSAFGLGSLQNVVNGSYNTAVGTYALDNIRNDYNTAIGHSSGASDSIAFRNVYVGARAGDHNSLTTSKDNNVMIGYEAGRDAEGDGNVFIGYQAGMNETGDNKLIIENSNSAAPLIYGDFATERVGIGMSAPFDALSVRAAETDNAFRVQIGTATRFRIFNNGSVSIGTNNTNISANDVYIHEQLGLGVSVPSYKLEMPNVAANSLGRGLANAWDTYSDQRVKMNVVPISYGLKEVLSMQPVQYDHHSSSFEEGYLVIDAESFKHDIGFLAQDMNSIISEVVSQPEDESKALWAMNYEKLVPVLVRAIQEQQVLLNQKDSQLAELVNTQSAILERLHALEVNRVSKVK
jgi:hypothetical protein